MIKNNFKCTPLNFWYKKLQISSCKFLKFISILSPQNKNTIKMPLRKNQINFVCQPVSNFSHHKRALMRFNKELLCASPVRYLLIFLIFQSLVNSNLYTHILHFIHCGDWKSEMCLKSWFFAFFFHSCASRHHISSGINFLSCSKQQSESGA